jgi:hypothetical protein
VSACLTYQFLPAGSFQVKTRAAGGTIKIYVYYLGAIAASASVSTDGTNLTVQTGA